MPTKYNLCKRKSYDFLGDIEAKALRLLSAYFEPINVIFGGCKGLEYSFAESLLDHPASVQLVRVNEGEEQS